MTSVIKRRRGYKAWVGNPRLGKGMRETERAMVSDRGGNVVAGAVELRNEDVPS